MNMIEIKNLNFKYKDNIIFQNLNLNIRKNVFITILGSNGSGKSTLARLLKNGCDGIKINETRIGFISSNPNDYIVGKTVKQQLEFHIKEQGITKEEKEKRINRIIKKYSLEEILNYDPFQLSNEYKQMIVLLSYVVSNFKVLILDDATCFLRENFKKQIFKFLKQRKITIINFTNNTEDCLFGEYIGIINNQNITLKKKSEILECEKIFVDNHIKLPFMAELSLKLKYYGLVNNVIVDMDEMVDSIWK